VGGAASDVEHRRGQLTHVREKLLVKKKGADLTLDRGTRAVDERIGQRRPRITGHVGDHLTRQCRRGASRSLYGRSASSP